MKKFLSIVFTVLFVFCVAAGQVTAQEYLINGVNPLALEMDAGSCQTISIAIDPAGVINTPLITGGCWLNFDVAQVTVASVAAADGTVPGPWDPGFTSIVPDAGGPGTYFLAVGQFATVAIDVVIPICDVELCCQAPGVSVIEVITIPNFDTVVGDTTLWDPQIAAGVINLTQTCCGACSCDIIGPSIVEPDAFTEVTAQYTATPVGGNCEPPAYMWSDDCTLANIDQTGLLTVPPTFDGETCTITVMDTANSDVNTGERVECTIPIEIAGCPCCRIVIAQGRECPGEEIDDPAYNRPGRRGLVATCGDVIDFTVCDDCVEEPCYEWAISPEVPWLEINQIDDCCWRLTIGENCEELTKTQEFEITVNDPCNFASDSIILEVGKVVIDLGDTAVNPESGTADVTVDLINPDHHLRALSFDITAIGNDNLVCTACTAHPDRALEFTCSAAEQANGDCRVVMYSTNPAALIAQGAGQIATVLFDAEDPAAGDCVDLMPINEMSSDQFNEDLCTCGAPGQVCFKTCGDIYPQDCIGGPCGDDETCGDGIVDLFDILEAIDIILGLQIATDCQIDNGDVPNGMPPYCGNPPGDPNCLTDGDVDIFDVLVIIDKALGKINCCDYCLFGQLF